MKLVPETADPIPQINPELLKCVCGGGKHVHEIVCQSCFIEVPISVRNSMKTAKTRQEREHIQRQILRGCTNLVARRREKKYGI